MLRCAGRAKGRDRSVAQECGEGDSREGWGYVKEREKGSGVINLATTGGNTQREWVNLQNTTKSFI